MQTEYDVLLKNKTWDFVPSSPLQNLISCKWIFRTKYKDGSIACHKARLVAKGFHQRPGLDYIETFSPVVKPATIRTVLSLAIIYGWSLRQIDINNAFLQGSLMEDVFMVQPPGFVSQSHPTHVCKLRQALYGLKQAPRAYVEVLPHPQGLFLSQHKYLQDLLTHAHMSNAKPVSTPMVTHPPLSTQTGASRLDISFAVNMLSQYMHKHTEDHWAALKRLLRYLTGTTIHGLLLCRDLLTTLHAFTDADWAGDKDDYISTTGYIVYLGRNPISWSSRKQRTLARSSTEAEYRAVAATTAEVLWVQNLLRELGYLPTNKPVIYCDNIGATYVAANPKFH
ncbi:hypothetical protein KPL71_012888 [Citrus sinensis]|uniref:Uncharacterized protein n=1 Tax=Citrus sinensis TaxID=2711 RepID=A0ACB8LEU4_CITSI|nr:hypothetical protein KPL71_012888 [Citrus sinensis]